MSWQARWVFPCAAAKAWLHEDLLRRLKEIVRRQRSLTPGLRSADDLRHVSSNLLIRILASLGHRVKVSVVQIGYGGMGAQHFRLWHRPATIAAVFMCQSSLHKASSE